MEAFLASTLDWISAHPFLAGVVVFLVAMSESLALVGLLVPGVAFMFGFGALIATGNMAFWPTVTWAVAGAVAGDGASFMLGRVFRDRLQTVYPFTRHPQLLDRGVTFFNRYGGKSVVFGRFVGPLRAVIPMVAGMLAMSPARFLAANVFSAILWAPAYLLPGMVFGASLELAAEVAFRLVLFIILLLGIVYALFSLLRFSIRMLQPYTSRWVQALLKWGGEHRFSRTIAVALGDPEHREAKGLALFALLLISAFIFAIVVTGLVAGDLSGKGLDLIVFEGLQSLRTPIGDRIMIDITRLGDIYVLFPFALLIFIYLMLRKQQPAAVHLIGAGAFAVIAIFVLKQVFGLPRPPLGLAGFETYSYPSGHTLGSTVIYGFLAILIADGIEASRRWIIYTCASLLVFMIALSRLYLGVHWLSDVMAGVFLGMIWISMLALGYHTHSTRHPEWHRLLLLSTTGLVCIYVAVAITNSQHDIHKYAVKPVISEINSARWLTGEWRSLPATRQDTLHRETQALNIQYAGNLQQLSSGLQQDGWIQVDTHNLRTWMKLFAAPTDIQQLPVMPLVNDGRHPALILEKTVNREKRYVLYLWDSHKLLMPAGRPLWIGLVSTQTIAEIPWLLTYASTQTPTEDNVKLIADALPGFKTDLRMRDDKAPTLLIIR